MASQPVDKNTWEFHFRNLRQAAPPTDSFGVFHAGCGGVPWVDGRPNCDHYARAAFIWNGHLVYLWDPQDPEALWSTSSLSVTPAVPQMALR